jgi:hypothetical protein
VLALVNGAVNNSATVTVDAPGQRGRHRHGQSLPLRRCHLRHVRRVPRREQHRGTGDDHGRLRRRHADHARQERDADRQRQDRHGAVATQTSRNKEPEGILAGIDDGTYVGTYHNLSRTTYPILQSYIATAVGALSLDAIQQPIDAVSIKVGKTIDFFACEHAVRRAYLALLEADRRYTGADLMSPDGGTKAAKKPTGRNITYGDIPIVVDRDAPYRMLFGVNKASWTRYVMNEGQWADDEGHVLKWVNDYDQWTAFFYILDNFHCQSPNRNFRMEGIDVNQLAHSPWSSAAAVKPADLTKSRAPRKRKRVSAAADGGQGGNEHAARSNPGAPSP